VKTTIQAGATLDTLTESELRAVLEEFASGYLRPPSPIRFTEGIPLDASGNGLVPCYQVPAGFDFLLTRLYLGAAASGGAPFTPAAPFTNAGSYLYLLRSQEAIEQLNLAAVPGLPFSFTWTDSYAPRWRDLETVTVQIVTGPLSGSVTARGQGVLRPLLPTL
jgi:hypothetical protein